METVINHYHYYYTNGEQRTLRKFYSSWNLTFIKSLFYAKTPPKQDNRRKAREPFPAVYKQNASCRVMLLTGTEFRPVTSNKRQQNEEAFFQKYSGHAQVSPMFPSYPYGKHCFHWKNWRSGNLSENPSTRAVAKILRAGASEHSSNFCEQFEQRPNFASILKLNGTIRYPFQ